MKHGCNLLKIANEINNISAEMGGVFSYSDLSSIIASGTILQNSRTIAKLTAAGILAKIQRGVYVATNYDMWLLASRLDPKSYISMDTVLAKEAIIATVPRRLVSAVRINKRCRRIETPLGEIVFHSMNRKLEFGITVQPNGVNVAVPERAYLDLLYFYLKGSRFVIDPLTEINLSKLNIPLIKKHLSWYKNPKFITFVKGLIA